MSTIPFEQAGQLAILFHLNSEPWMNKQAYDEPPAPHELSSFENAEKIVALPAAASTPLFDLIRSRRSCRAFAPAPMPLEQFGTLLQQAYGVVGLREESGGSFHEIPVPSAGAMYPLELYAIAQQVTGLPDGLYHYAGWHHRLECLQSGIQLSDLLPNLQEQRYILGANALLFLTAVLPRTMKKYGPRGYRYILIEAGHAAQNVCLLAAEQGLGTLCLGGFRDSYFNNLMGFDPRVAGVMYAIAIGHRGTA
ncbi:MAG: SagB/ThcOx family dehydrogenase [Bryobacteraceae bacterium]